MKLCKYEGMRGQWRWSLVAANGRIIADSAESYVSRSNLDRAVDRFLEEAPHITVLEPPTPEGT